MRPCLEFAVSALLAVATLAATAAETSGAPSPQAPEKARSAPKAWTTTFSGTLEIPVASGAQAGDGIVAVDVRSGDEVRHFAIGVEEAPGVPRTSAAHYGQPIAG